MEALVDDNLLEIVRHLNLLDRIVFAMTHKRALALWQRGSSAGNWRMRHWLICFASVAQLRHFRSEPVSLFYLCMAASYCADRDDSEHCSVLLEVLEKDWGNFSYPRPKIRFIAWLVDSRQYETGNRQPDNLFRYLDHWLSDADKKTVDDQNSISRRFFATITNETEEETGTKKL
jgi:hypothetical protein